MDKQKEQNESLASIQEELQNYKDILTEALKTIKERIPDIETIQPSNKDKEVED